MTEKQRCWAIAHDRLLCEYHDTEWGVPLHDERKHFEFLLLEFFQAGLSWKTMLYKRENFRKAFAGFDPVKIAGFGEKEINRLLDDSGIIRNRAKISAAIHNARYFLKIREKIGSFDSYIWQFTEGRQLENRWTEPGQIPVTSDLSDKVSKDLRQHGFKFVGSTTIYAHLQAIGIINDHLVSCFRHDECLQP
ncbi:MAG: DNA-3-methyladenine glycosylase I [Spirochaetales bacterium]|nr:DNA-3-methyladenine glycosylase I [Spirochaetales bacterium]